MKRLSFYIGIVLFSFQLSGQTMNIGATRDLNFGDFTVHGPGTLSINHDDSAVASGGVTLFGIDQHAATFLLTITAERTINIYFPPGQYITREGGAETISVDLGPSDKGLSFPASALPLENYINIGGTLNLSNVASDPAGNYSGTLEVEFTITGE